ncbi:5-hydroxyisourate hydrolase (HIU hydrolase) (HIUHase) [Mucor velutinosus]|uniref:5-hydroxyisourate hydrolase (HIU hydrolase) (HIUHase) n=1 Tax=Mucor velutinosus TaxID=708070 RepID=A0AAN7HX92_9FUNG|nr:5-hydroxyisourate hydrolase (HIU hydrolase) (HIUHase) [Mucor velutinosus]
MNVVKEIQRINQREISSGSWSDSGSWHNQYKNSAWIYAGGLPYDLTEGDIVCIFSQYGEIIHIELIRDQKTGKSKGFAFLQYEDQRSTVLAVDNLNGATVLGRTIRVDHSHTGPKKHKKQGEEDDSDDDQPKMNVAPEMIEVGPEKKSKPAKMDMDGDEEDPMAAYFREKNEKKSKKKDKKSSSSSSRHHKHKSTRDRSREERHHRSSRDDDRHRSSSRRERSPEETSRRDDKYSSRRRSRSPRSRSRSYSRSPSRRRSRSPRRRY